MPNITIAQEVCDCFEALFADKEIIPLELELQWLKMAVGEYGMMLEPLSYDSNACVFADALPQETINILAQYMNVYYQERYASKVNKRVSIVTKDISIDGQNGAKTAAKAELDYKREKLNYMVNNAKPTAYS